jgi:hypothetical protein
MAETEDYLSTHTRITYYFSKLFVPLLCHSFYYGWNQPWASIMPELLGRRHRRDTFRVDKLVFLCPILELMLIGLNFVHLVCVDVET